MEIPEKKDLPGLRSGDKIVIKGKLKGDSGSFQVTLCYEDKNIIPLHLDAQFGETGLVLSRIRRNRQLGDKIQIDKKFPSGEFEITIDVTDRNFKVTVNKNHSKDFAHKDDFRNIKNLKVTGDIVLDQEPQLTKNNRYKPGELSF